MTRLRLLTASMLSGGFIVIGILWIYCIFMVVSLKDKAWLEATNNSDNLLHSVERAIDRDLELYDLSLSAVVDGLKNPLVEGLSPELRQLVLFDRSSQAQGYGSIFVLDQAGNAYIDSANVIPRSLNGSDREYFIIHKTLDAGLFIGRPWKTRISGRLMIPLSRRLTFADETFAGVVVGAIELSYFEKIFKRFNPDPALKVDIVFEDGDFIDTDKNGADMFGPALLTDEDTQNIRSRTTGSFISTNSLTSPSKLHTFSKVGKWPLHVNVSQLISSIDGKWRLEAIGLIAAVLTMSACGLTLLMFLRKELLLRFSVEAELERIALTDSLTGIPNRRHFDAELNRLYQLPSFNSSGLIFIDVDHFKQYNDTYGHPAGDKVLISVGRIVHERSKTAGCSAFRIGGEEFAIILVDVDEGRSRLIAEEVRRLIVNASIPHDNGVNGLGGVVTVSMGVVHTSRHKVNSIAQLLGDVDDALYSAKRAGRNRIHSKAVYTTLESKAVDSGKTNLPKIGSAA